MSDFPTSWDPYAPPQAQPAPVVRGPLPTGFKVICIIAIVLGGLGTLSSCGGMAALAIGPSLQNAFGLPEAAEADAQMRAQQELQAKLDAVGQEYLPFTIVASILHLLAGLGLLFGGIFSLKLSPTGRFLLLVGCVVAIFYELVQGVLAVVVQMRTIPLAKESVNQALQQGGQAELPPAFGQFVLMMMFVMLAIMAVTVLVKIVFYVISIFYLKKPHIVARFAG